MMDLVFSWNELFNNIVTGIVSSCVFLFLLWNFKPHFKISDKICCEETIFNGIPKKIFLFKVVNKSCFFNVYDVMVKASIVKPEKNVNDKNSTLSVLPIEFNAVALVHTFHFAHYFQDLLQGERTLTKRTDYAAKFFTTHDCREILQDNEKYIQFQIIAKHALTGFSKVKTMRYDHMLKVEDGSFLSGNSFKIVSNCNKPTISTN